MTTIPDFSFATTKSIVFADGALEQLGTHALALGGSHVFLVTDTGLGALGFPQRAHDILAKAGLGCTIFDKVVADPPEHLVADAVAMAKTEGCDLVVGFGGGSSMDVAKLIALMLKSPQELADIYGVGLAKGERLPLIQVPTTAGTGSEVTPIAILTLPSDQKMGVVSPQLLPDLALLDPELTLGLPPKMTAATGIDAMVHAIEAYTSRIKKNPLSDALAREALRLMGANIREAVHNGTNREARGAMLLGSMLAGQAFANAPVGAVHALAYPLGGHYHITHGLSNTLMLTPVMAFNAPVAAPLYAEIAPIIDPAIQPSGAQAMTQDLITSLASLTKDLGLETSLAQVGVEESKLEILARDAFKQQRLLQNNPREVSEADALALYRESYAGFA